MSNLAERFAENPLIKPTDLTPSAPGLKVEYVINPGAFEREGRIYLVARVAERPEPKPGRVRIPVLENGKLRILDWDASDPEVNTADPREYKYKGEGYLSTVSHFQLFVSDDGRHFKPVPDCLLWSEGELETYGIDDCRVTSFADGRYFLTYTAISQWGYGVGLRVTSDWKKFEHLGLMMLPANKDAAIFESKINGRYVCLNRPTGVVVGGNYMWLSFSDDLVNWGGHKPVARTRPGMWDSGRVGAGAAPIRTEQGWLELYHGATLENRYCLGAMLLDLNEPWKVLARSEKPIMEPETEWERKGFFGNVVFTNGHVVRGDDIYLYYGAADTVIGGAKFSIKRILESLRK